MFETRALTGQLAPNTSGDIFWVFDLPPVINSSGQVGFNARLQLHGDYGVWSEGSGTLSLVAQEGDPAPDTEVGSVFSSFGNDVFRNLILNSSGHTAFHAQLSTQIFGYWSENADGLSAIVRRYSPVPDTNETLHFDYFDNNGLALNSSGKSVFRVLVTGDGVDATNTLSIWTDFNGALNMVAREGDIIPGASDATVFKALIGPVINNSGHIAFFSTLIGPNVDSANDQALWSDRSGTLAPIVRGGDTAPNIGTDIVFDNFGLPGINSLGQVAFQGSLSGPGIDNTNNVGAWSEGSGTLELVARKGEPAPGTDADLVFAQIDNNLVINGAGQVGFTGILAGPGIDRFNDDGVWFGETGSLRLIARDGEYAFGTSDGAKFFGFADPVLNDSGQIAFYASLSGDNVSSVNNSGIWATDLNGDLLLIVREGELFDVNNDPLIEDLRTVREIRMVENTGGQDGRPTPFNDNGQITFKLKFSDNTEGIFVATIGIPGDLDGDGFVGIEDLNIVLGNWNQLVPPGDQSADPSGDGFVGIEDLNKVLGSWNAGTPPSSNANIPEPVSLGLLLAGSVILLQRSV